VGLDQVPAAPFLLMAPHLTGRQRRLLFGAAARALGYGGVSRVARLAEASRPTVRRGVAELHQQADPRGRIRQHEGPTRGRWWQQVGRLAYPQAERLLVSAAAGGSNGYRVIPTPR
jgi:Rhodopirellula transposase DDE domain